MAGYDVGDTTLVLYLSGVNDEQIEALAEGMADLCVEHGLAGEDDDDEVRALIGQRPEPWPDFDDDHAMAAFLSQHVRFVIPGGSRES